MDIQILYEDEDIIALNKPAGIVVNRAETTKDMVTVQDWAEERLGIHTQNIGETKKYGEEGWDPKNDFYSRGGIVHRLDKETSGVLLIAKNPEAFVALLDEFRERKVTKMYHALVHGKLVPSEGEISVPVGRLPWNKKLFGIIPGGKPSKTQYKVLFVVENTQTKEKMSYLEIYPQSGRTHQIRVHCKYIHHPVFADYLYAGRKTARSDRKMLTRVFLHAAYISFTHPKTMEQLHVNAPLPQELKTCLEWFAKV